MGFIENIKIKVGKHRLKKETEAIKRKRSFFNFNYTKTAGILYEASKTEDYELVNKYVSYLKGEGIKTKTIGYFSQKEIPEFSFSKTEYSFFTKKETNWFYRPPIETNDFISKFVNEEFDLLIDLNIFDHFPLKYLSSISKAKFKIGKYSDENKAIYDMMMEISSEKSLKYFLKETDTYLHMLNNKN